MNKVSRRRCDEPWRCADVPEPLCGSHRLAVRGRHSGLVQADSRSASIWAPGAEANVAAHHVW